MNRGQKRISIVIPCYRSEQTIGRVVDEIEHTIAARPEYEYEVILVNDGSPDNTFQVLTRLAHQYDNITAVNLSRNFGQHCALLAAYSLVTGDYVLEMDDDGEHDPSQMFRLVDRLEEGYDYVCCKFTARERESYKSIGSRVNDWMATFFIGKPQDTCFSSYCIMRRFVVEEILKTPTPNIYIGGMIVAVTRKLSYVEIEAHPRYAGKSGYRFRNSLQLWMNGIVSYSVKPLRLASLFGIFFAILGFLLAFVKIIEKIIRPDILLGYTSLIVVVLVTSGVMMVLLGIIGEYIGRACMIMNHIPQYVIRDVVLSEALENAESKEYANV